MLVNGGASTRRSVERCVPQGSILDPLLFCISVNDLPGKINHCSVRLLEDEVALGKVTSWVDNNGLKMNMKMTQVMFLGRKG